MEQEIYITLWSGGYDMPSIFISKDRTQAMNQLREWLEVAEADSDLDSIISCYRAYTTEASDTFLIDEIIEG